MNRRLFGFCVFCLLAILFLSPVAYGVGGITYAVGGQVIIDGTQTGMPANVTIEVIVFWSDGTFTTKEGTTTSDDFGKFYADSFFFTVPLGQHVSSISTHCTAAQTGWKDVGGGDGEQEGYPPHGITVDNILMQPD